MINNSKQPMTVNESCQLVCTRGTPISGQVLMSVSVSVFLGETGI